MSDGPLCPHAGKIKYASKSDAVLVLSGLNGRHGGDQRAYLCPSCRRYHIGHQINKRKQRASEREQDRKRRKWRKDFTQLNDE